MRWADTVTTVAGYLVLGCIIAGMGLYVKACDERRMGCAERVYTACKTSGGEDCTMTAEKICSGSAAR